MNILNFPEKFEFLLTLISRACATIIYQNETICFKKWSTGGLLILSKAALLSNKTKAIQVIPNTWRSSS